ncbi:polysaccharide deacetylase family protein [Nodosilinea sp. PGN35]|uniref:polysaccharide deacetylase family protein n=1 Tax=Nodosilinea sp. PGN35 TaxID=3020489 RepID=UPI0023B20E06|nr:polysaccharide deacetylase family protein [Nodosilinea sp. TSF1-S3]MDF0367336.1 polysaccharide deacetylase family protein [Nodosilinea sp. TSF1-S3]
MSRLLDTYHRLTDRVRMRSTAKAAILMYHRIADSDLDPWRLSVSPQHFAEHLEVVCQWAQPLSLQQLAAAQRAGNVPPRAVAITFDDGYANNLHNAKPLLEQYSVPATVFVTSGTLDAEREPWWDELEQVLLQPGPLPDTLSLTIGGSPRHWQLGKAAYYSEADRKSDHHLQAWHGRPNSRLEFYYSVWSALKVLPAQQRQELQDEILAWANACPYARETCRTLTRSELLNLEQGGLVEIGAHTVTHPSLPAHSLTAQRQEIGRSKQDLEACLKHPVTSFAYPFGDFDRNSLKAVQENGFSQACSTVQQPVWQGCDRFQLPRFEVQNWPRETFQQKLNTWLK